MTASKIFNWVQPGLAAMPETDGHGDTCGPIVIADYLHLLGRFNLTIANIDSLRQDLITWGLMDVRNSNGVEVGMTLSQIYAAFTDHFKIKPVKYVGFNENLNFNTFHQDIIHALTNKQLVVYETANAAALPDGQRRIKYHFVLLGGINSLKGYLTCNGDTYTALKSKVPVSPVWYGIGSIQASMPCGYMILPAIQEPAPPAATPAAPVVAAPPKPTEPVSTTVESIPTPLTAEQVLEKLHAFADDISSFLKEYKW